MGDIPLSNLSKVFKAEMVIPSICIAVSLLGAGLVFFGDIFHDAPPSHVTLEAQDLSEEYLTTARTVGEFLDEIGIQFSQYDLIEPSTSTPIQPGIVVSFAGANRVYLADSGGVEREVMCSGETVCDLLNQCGLDIGPMDRVVPHPATPIEPDLHVEITRVDVLDVTLEREIDPGVIIEPDPDLARGRVVEVSSGVPGLAEDVVRYYYRNGEETAQVEIGSRVIFEPQDSVKRIGVRYVPLLASRGSAHRDVLSMVATGYDPGPKSCAPYADGRTATGHIAGKGVCAVDPNVIPLGTNLWIEGYGYALACDTGGAIKGNRIDLCYDTRTEALKWGRRTVLVYVLE